MTPVVEHDFEEFVAARWPELESAALVVVLDVEVARSTTADALARLRGRWQDAVDAGRPGEDARRAVLRGAVAAARGTTGAGHQVPDAAPPPVPPAHSSPIPSAHPWEDDPPTDDPVVRALVAAIRTAPPVERAVLAGESVWHCGPDEVARLLDLPPGTVGEHAASLGARLAAAHDAARVTGGHEPSPWSRDRDVAAAVEQLLRGQSDPPDPAALVAHRAGGLRRRTLVTGGGAALALALAGVGVVLVRRGTSDPPTTAGPPVERLAPDDPRWASVQLWPARGPLAGDPAVALLVARSGDPRNRVLWAGDIATQRVVLALAHTGVAVQGEENFDVVQEEPFVRAYQGPKGSDPLVLRDVPLQSYAPPGAGEVVALTLPGDVSRLPDGQGSEATRQRQSLLVVLTRPTRSTASISHAVVPLPNGTVERSWSPLPLQAGISTTTVDLAAPVATALRVGSWEGLVDSFTSVWDIVSGADPSTSSQWAQAPITAVTGIPENRLTTTVFVDEEMPGGLFEWPAPADAAPARLTSLLTTTPEGAVLRTTAYHGTGFNVGLEPAQHFTRGTERDPLVAWAADEREGITRFLVAAPGADRVQLISTSPDGYPVSKVVRTGGRNAVVVPVVNGNQAGEYRVITKDAKGRVLFDGVPSPGRFLLDT